jgi:hypothetical protein
MVQTLKMKIFTHDNDCNTYITHYKKKKVVMMFSIFF